MPKKFKPKEFRDEQPVREMLREAWATAGDEDWISGLNFLVTVTGNIFGYYSIGSLLYTVAFFVHFVINDYSIEAVSQMTSWALWAFLALSALEMLINRRDCVPLEIVRSSLEIRDPDPSDILDVAAWVNSTVGGTILLIITVLIQLLMVFQLPKALSVNFLLSWLCGVEDGSGLGPRVAFADTYKFPLTLLSTLAGASFGLALDCLAHWMDWEDDDDEEEEDEEGLLWW